MPAKDYTSILEIHNSTNCGGAIKFFNIMQASNQIIYKNARFVK